MLSRELAVRDESVVEPQGFMPRGPGFSELADDQCLSGRFDPRLLLGGLVLLEAHQKLVGDLQRAGLRLDLHADPVEQRLRRRLLRHPGGLHLGLQAESGAVLLQEPFQPPLRKAESLQGVPPKRRLKGCAESLLGREPGKKKERFEEIALARCVGPHQDHERRQFDVDIVQGFEALDAKPCQQGPPLSSRSQRSGQADATTAGGGREGPAPGRLVEATATSAPGTSSAADRSRRGRSSRPARGSPSAP